LEKHWPDVPRWRDIRTLTGESFYERTGRTTVDLISGGFPCQPFSTASHGNKTAIDLSGEFLRVVANIRPKYAIGENVNQGIIKTIANKLSYIGYRAIAISSNAYGFGACHVRNRWWCIAYPNNKGELQGRIYAKMAELRQIQNTAWSAEAFTGVVRVDDGLPHRMDRLKCLGNAVVPQQVYPILAAIAELEATHD